MKILTTIWTLVCDDDSGPNCLVFATEEECMSHFRKLIENNLSEIHTACADEIRRLLVDGEIGDAYSLWQETYKEHLDAYYWGSQQLELELETALPSGAR